MAARRVVIAGGGVAAVETLLALRESRHGRELDVTLVAPNQLLAYRPLTVLEPFGLAPVRRYSLADICEHRQARLLADTLTAVDGDARVAITGSGEPVPYDALVIAVGARRSAAYDRACTFSADRGGGDVRAILDAIAVRRTRSVAFVVPPGNGWSLPLYELALLTARHAREAGVRGDLTLSLVTPEETPLAIFHGGGSIAVAALLDGAGIWAMTSAYVAGYDGRTLDIRPGDRALTADRVIALPALAGPGIDGVPSDEHGFVRADEYRRVPGLDGVYAIGDATTFTVKHGGIAAQHADLVASLIARTAGPDPSTRPHLRAVLLTGEEPLYLQATISGGRSIASSASRTCPWWPPHKIAARHLAPYLADRVPVDDGAAGLAPLRTEAS